MLLRILFLPIGLFLASTASPKAQNTYGIFAITGFDQTTLSFLEDVSGNGPTFGFGYHISDMLSAEASFSNLEYEDDYVMDVERRSDGAEGTISISGDVETTDFALIVRRDTNIPKPHVSPYLMMGMMDFNASDSVMDINYPNHPNDFTRLSGANETENYFGFGVDLLPDKNGIGFRLNYKIVGGDVDADFLSFGILFDF